jgi:hypothetical protein
MNHALPAGEDTTHAIDVQLTTLDEAIRIDAAAIPNIDVEGYETSVIAGAEKTLENPLLHSIIMELSGSGSRYGINEGTILKRLSDSGFEPFVNIPFERKLVSLQGKNAASGNTLFIRDKDLVTHRLALAPKFRTHGVEL